MVVVEVGLESMGPTTCKRMSIAWPAVLVELYILAGILTAALDLGMPAGVYQGYDAQSDREAAPLLNGTSALKLFCPDVSAPFFYIRCC